MSALKCVKCGTFRFLGGSCTYCSGNEKQNEQSPNSGAASHDSKGKETGQKLSTSQEFQEKILPTSGNVAAFYAPQASAVGGNPIAGQFRFPYNLAGHGHYPPPGSNFGSAQSIATNQMEAIAPQQMFHYFQSVMAMHQQAIVNQGQNRDFYLQRMNMPALGPAHTFGNVAPPLRVPVAAASTANYSLPGPSNQSFEGRIVPERFNSSADTNPKDAFCLMCEEYFQNIETHKTKFHPNFVNSLGRSDFSCFVSFFEGKVICYYRGTDPAELKICPICQNVFYKYRCYHHHGCRVQIDIPDLPIASLLTGQPHIGDAPRTEYCLMCKSFFDNVHQHWSTLHIGNNNYTMRRVYGQMTLFPNVNQLDDLCKCKICFQLKLKKKFSPNVFMCNSCYKKYT